MTKRLVAVTGEYQKDGQPKAEYTEIGVIITGKNGKEYALLDPAINLAGVLMKQNALSAKRNEPPGDKVLLSLFEQDNQQQNNQQQQPQGNYQGQQQQQQQQPQSNQQQGGYQQQQSSGYNRK